jgi:Putative transposon-encoded protein (DUF2080)
MNVLKTILTNRLRYKIKKKKKNSDLTDLFFTQASRFILATTMHIYVLIYGEKDESYDNTSWKCVTPSGNSGHVVVPKAWIGKEASNIEGKRK